MNFFLKFAPHTFRMQMLLVFGVLSMLIGLPTYFYVSSQHQMQLIDYKRETLNGVARSAATLLAESLSERYREIVLLAQSPTYRELNLSHSNVRASVERVKQSYPHYSWIGVTDEHGQVQSATSSHLEGVNVSKRPWFQAGIKAPYVGDVHEALLLAKLLPSSKTDQTLRFIDFSAPILDKNGLVKGVLGAHTQWNWASDLLDTTISPHAARNGVSVFILNNKGEIIYPEDVPEKLKPPSLETLSHEVRGDFLSWGGETLYLTAAASVATPTSNNPLGWQVVVRQVESSVLAEVSSLQRVNLFAMLMAGLAFLVLAWVVSNRISRPVEALTKTARRIENGEQHVHFSESFWALELQKLSDALRGMSNTLMRQKEELTLSNQDLEARVVDRTAELQKLNVTLKHMARTDALTGLANRMRTNERLTEEFALFQRSKIPYCILMVDIDYFKRVNDTYGHAVGDEVLKCVAESMRETVRKTDFLARMGGEEFLVILLMTHLEVATKVAEKIREAIASMHIAPAGNVTVSIGIQEVTADDVDQNEAVIRADAWLYRAKEAGRNRVMMQDAVD